MLILPIAVYFIAEQLLGAEWAIVLSITFTFISAMWSRRACGSLNKTELISDILLIALFGITDIVLAKQSDGLRPLVTSLIFTAFLSLTLIPRLGLLRSLMGKINPYSLSNPYVVYLMERSAVRMVIWAIIATLLYAYAYVYPDTRAALWISGYTIMTIMFAYVATEIIWAHVRKRKYKDCEWVQLVTADGKTCGGCPRPLVHNGSHWLHAVVHLHVVHNGRLLLQLRPKTKKIQGGKWDTAVGGHVAYGEKLPNALSREAVEEIGIRNFEARLVARYMWHSDVEDEYVLSFIAQNGGPFAPQNVGEVDELKFWTKDEIVASMGKNVFTPNLEHELQQNILNIL